jgi:hypothetical protein
MSLSIDEAGGNDFGLLYSFSGVVHGLSRNDRVSSATQPVSNAVAMLAQDANSFLSGVRSSGYFGFGPGTNRAPVRLPNLGQLLGQGPNPNADTHSQVMTRKSHYTACAPRSL